MRSPNSQRGAEPPKQLFKARVPYDAIAILKIVKRDQLEPAVVRWHIKVLETDGSTLSGRVLQTVYGHKLEQAQHELDAASFVTDSKSNGLGMVVSGEQIPLLSTANILIYENLKDLNPPDMTGRALARSALITLEAMPPSSAYGLAA